MKEPWLWAAIAMMACLIPCGIRCFKGRAEDRLVGLEMAGMILCLDIVLFAQAFGRPILYDLALTMGILSFGSGLVVARFLERWL